MTFQQYFIAFFWNDKVINTHRKKHQYIAQQCTSEDEVSQIFVKNADGSNKHALITGPDVKRRKPAWSPDGKSIAYLRTEGGKDQIWTVNLADKKKQMVTQAAGKYTTVSWSKSSDKLVFIDQDDYLSIINVDGSDKHKVSNRKGFFEPFWY